MASLQFAIQPLPCTDESFVERIRDVSEKMNKQGVSTNRVFEQLKVPVKEIVIGPNHLGLLLEDGRAYRVAYTICIDRLDLHKHDASKSNPTGSVNSTNNKSANHSSRQLARSRARLMRTTGRTGGQGSGSRSTGVIIGGSNRPLVTVPATYVPEELISQAEVVLQGKSRNLIIRELQRTNLDVNLAVNNLLSRDDEEADDNDESGENYVPEDLISLLDNGFHGDNGSVIIDPADGLFSEEIFSNYSSIRNLLFDRIRSERTQTNSLNSENNQARNSSSSSLISNAASLSAQISSVTADREAFSRWRDRQYYGPRRWINKDDPVWEKETDHKKKDCSTTASPIWISEELIQWPEKNTNMRFKKIAALYSEFIALSVNGELHQWKWNEVEPYYSEEENVFHPKTISLNLTDKIVYISANFIRSSVVTENNKIATWMDEHLGYLGAKLEHAVFTVNEFAMDPITSIHVCSLYSVVKTESNNIYWWGVLPYEQRRYLWEKFKTKTKKPSKIPTADLLVGSQVVMKKCPIYQTGSIGFTYVNGIPKVGQLLNSVWEFSDTSRFKILNVNSNSTDKIQSGQCNLPMEKDMKVNVITSSNSQTNTSSKCISNNNSKETTDRLDMPPPPSPASSTCSDTGSVSSHKRQKRITTKEESEVKIDEEVWHLKDVVFVEDKVGPIGKVLKVDGDFVAVRFPVSNTNVLNFNTSGVECKEDDWQQCRLLRREDVQVYKTALTSRGPDWLQKLPKKININQHLDSNNFQLLALGVDTRGIHIIKKIATKVWYSLYNLYNSKQEHTCHFPTDCTSFIGTSSNNIELCCNNDCSGNTSTILLCDGYRTIYPLAKDCTDSIKDPQWLDLPPVKTMCMSTVSLSSNGNNQNTKVCLTAILFESQKLMPHILRCDVKSSFAVLNQFDKNEKDLSLLIDERCDGGRNLFHACAFMCAPTSNKDFEDKKVPIHGIPLKVATSTCIFSNGSNSGGGCLDTNTCSNSLSSFSNVPVNMNPANMSREGRTVSLREMMSRLINNDVEHHSNVNSNPISSNASSDDHLYMPPWTLDPESANSGDSIKTISQDDINKLIPSSGSSNSGNSKLTNTSSFNIENIQRKDQALIILQHMCMLPSFRPFLRKFLSAKDAQGQTPFMLAVSNRAYEAGLLLLSTISNIAENDSSIKESMIFPIGSPPDQSPLYVICYNDTCSFTWTGADHINQNIFECKTCGLTGSLCCCTECARVCHQGHDCKLKRTSPTAYCDCWEKCKCKALVAGNQHKRFTLLSTLASSTDLVTKFNSKGEPILLFLIQTVGRQTVEQRQYRANSRIRNVGTGSSNNVSRKSSNDLDTEMPEHDLEPPKFARKALERLLVEWQAVRAMIMTGTENCENVHNCYTNQGMSADNQNIYLQTQQSSTLLDKFTHNLFVKCSGEHLDTLLTTLLREMQNEKNEGRIKEAESVARRFVRSVTRIYVIFNLEKLPIPEKRKANFSPNKHIYNCIKVFQALQKISIQELCEVAEALIAPVRLGVVRPTAPFAMSSLSVETSDDLFSVEPLTPSSNFDNVEISNVRDSNGQGAFHLQTNFSTDNANAQLEDGLPPDDNSNRETNVLNQDDDILDSHRNDDGVVEEESDNDNDFTFNDAETESDSDDNHSNQEAQRGVQTGTTVGSEADIGVLFLEDESGDSSPQDEEGSEGGETDDHSDDFNFGDNQLERRNVAMGHRTELAPQSMQWAIRNRETVRSSVRVPSGSNLVFIDPMALRRTTAPNSTSVNTISPESHTMATTAGNLARAFGIIVRQISELLETFSFNVIKTNECSLKFKLDDVISLQNFVETRLKCTWDWMFSVMDGTEAQLKFGAYLTNFTDPTHPLHPLNLNNNSTTSQTNSSQMALNMTGVSSRREFFSYCLSLMRAHTFEHRDSLPVLDVTALRHIAYVLDSFIYYMRNDNNLANKSEFSSNHNNLTENDETDEEFCDNFCSSSYADSTSSTCRHSFFLRSESTLSLGCLPPEGFDLPLDVAMPLADKPHLLQPNSKREDLFANLPLLTTPVSEKNMKNSHFTMDYPPTKLSFSKYSNFNRKQDMEFQSPKSVITSVVSEEIKIKNATTEEKSTTEDKNMFIQTKDYFESHEGENEPKESSSRPDIIVAPHRMEKSSVSKTLNIIRSVIVRAGNNTDSKSSINKNIEKKMNSQKIALSFQPRGSYFCNNFLLNDLSPSWNFLLGRWKLALDLFGRVFMDDVGMESGSVLPELRGFPVKEMRFRRYMEKLRNGQQRDLILCKLERNRELLIIQTFKELNTQFGTQNRRVHPPLTFNRVKVTFKDEPGEGSGVARSFYTSISEALLASAKMPNLEIAQSSSNSGKYGVPFASIMRKHTSSSRDQSNAQKRVGTGSKILWRNARERKNLNYDARPYVPHQIVPDNLSDNPNDHLSIHLQQLGERLYPKIHSISSSNASKITGMLLEIPTPQLLSILSSEETLRQKVLEALDIIHYKQKPEGMNSSTQTKKLIPVVLLEQCPIEDNEPLFYSPGKRGFYTPRQGFGSFERINAFRNIGRLIGLCLLQNELLPLFLQRHVLKYILGRRIKYHDLAFFDPVVYESFRQLLQSIKSETGEDLVKRMDLFFVIDLIKEEGGGSVELIPNGREIQVTSKNIFDYVKRYTEYRLIKSQEKSLEALKDGVFDVLPENSMCNLSSEDLRLLLNGVGNINVSTLISYTTFNDESSEGSDKLLKFKRWFWSIVEKMNSLERQDLVYFWTGSPALPASEEGFQPLPSVTIRPADDSHLPTANTCISRLYIPLYSSKIILRSKLLLAIKSKNFGFV